MVRAFAAFLLAFLGPTLSSAMPGPGPGPAEPPCDPPDATWEKVGRSYYKRVRHIL